MGWNTVCSCMSRTTAPSSRLSSVCTHGWCAHGRESCADVTPKKTRGPCLILPDFRLTATSYPERNASSLSANRSVSPPHVTPANIWICPRYFVCVANRSSAGQQSLFREGRRMRPPVSPPTPKHPHTARETGSAEGAAGGGSRAARRPLSSVLPGSRRPHAPPGPAGPGPPPPRSPKPQRGGPPPPAPPPRAGTCAGAAVLAAGWLIPRPGPAARPAGPRSPAALGVPSAPRGRLPLGPGARAAPPHSRGPRRAAVVTIAAAVCFHPLRAERGRDGRTKEGREEAPERPPPHFPHAALGGPAPREAGGAAGCGGRRAAPIAGGRGAANLPGGIRSSTPGGGGACGPGPAPPRASRRPRAAPGR